MPIHPSHKPNYAHKPGKAPKATKWMSPPKQKALVSSIDLALDYRHNQRNLKSPWYYVWQNAIAPLAESKTNTQWQILHQHAVYQYNADIPDDLTDASEFEDPGAVDSDQDEERDHSAAGSGEQDARHLGPTTLEYSPDPIDLLRYRPDGPDESTESSYSTELDSLPASDDTAYTMPLSRSTGRERILDALLALLSLHQSSIDKLKVLYVITRLRKSLVVEVKPYPSRYLDANSAKFRQLLSNKLSEAREQIYIQISFLFLEDSSLGHVHAIAASGHLWQHRIFRREDYSANDLAILTTKDFENSDHRFPDITKEREWTSTCMLTTIESTQRLQAICDDLLA